MLAFFHIACLCVGWLQQAFNATVAINHMKKLQLAHSEMLAKQAQGPVPDIKVVDLSTPGPSRKNLVLENLEPNGNLSHGHMTLPSNPNEPKSHYYPTRPNHSEPTHAEGCHALTLAEKGKHAYHSEPANLNGTAKQYGYTHIHHIYHIFQLLRFMPSGLA